MRLCNRLAPDKAVMSRMFAGLIFTIAGYMLYRNVGAVLAG